MANRRGGSASRREQIEIVQQRDQLATEHEFLQFIAGVGAGAVEEKFLPESGNVPGPAARAHLLGESWIDHGFGN